MDRKMTRRRLLQTATTSTMLLAGCIGNPGGGDNGADMTTTESTPEETESPMTTPTLAVSDQSVTNMQVSFPEVAIDDTGWLVVHPEADGGGPKGTVVLGKQMLESGFDDSVELGLDVVTTAGRTVYGMLHYDDPADNAFTFPQNGDPPVKKDGSPIVKPFEVSLEGSVTPELSVMDQTTDGSAVTIPKAAIDESGWLVVHPEADSGGPNGSVVLAKEQLAPGMYADQTLSVEATLSEDQTLYGMLHYDDPADNAFTFPQNGDPPVKKDGSPIVKPFDVTISGGTTTVEAISTSFKPERVSVEPGTTVKWVNKDSYGHDVTSASFHDKAKSWDMSATLSGNGETASHTFQEAGVYEYYCTIHGKDTMCGAVLVGDATLDADLPCEGSTGGAY